MKATNKAQVVSVSLPLDMTKEVQEMARDERRSVSEVIREAFRQYAANKVLKDVRIEARKSAKAKGIKPSEVPAIVREGRK